MTAACGHSTSDVRSGLCYGCWLRQKDLSISGETVAGWTFGRKPLLLSDRAIDQRVEGGNQMQAVSDAMKAGGPVVQDRLQRDVDKHTARIMDACAADGAKPMYAPTPTGFPDKPTPGLAVSDWAQKMTNPA